MKLSFLLFLLALTAGPAFASTSTNGDEVTAAPKVRISTQTNTTQETDAVNSSPAVTIPAVPARPRSTVPRTVSPRWHSMLPGMFR